MGEGRGGWGVRERELRMADAPLAPTPTPAPPENPTWRSHARDSWSSRSWASGHRPDSNNNVMPKRGRNYPAIFCRSKKLSRHTAIYAPKLSRYFSPAKKLSRRTILRGRKLSRLSRPGAHVKTRSSQSFSDRRLRFGPRSIFVPLRSSTQSCSAFHSGHCQADLGSFAAGDGRGRD